MKKGMWQYFKVYNQKKIQSRAFYVLNKTNFSYLKAYSMSNL